MPSIGLIEPSSTEESIARARTLDDEFGFRQRFRADTPDGLIAYFNSQVGVFAWVRARAVCLIALRDALLATGMDCSSFISPSGMSLRHKVQRHSNAIVPVDPSGRLPE